MRPLLAAILPLALSACSSGSPYLVASGQPGALATSQDAIIWLSSGGAAGTDQGVELLGGQVMRAPISGGAVTTLASVPGNLGGVAITADAVFFTSMHLDPTDNRMRSTLHRVALSGGAATEVDTIVSQVADTGPVTADATNVYWVTWTNPGGEVLHATPIAGGPTKTLFTAPHDDSIGGLATDGTAVYFTLASPEDGPGSVMKVPVQGGSPITLASGQSDPFSIAVDATSVYWTNLVPDDGAVMKVPLAGGAPITLAAHQSLPSSIVVDATSVYWTGLASGDPGTAPGTVSKVPLAGGTPVTIVQGLPEPRSVALAGADLFWTDDDGLERAAKSPAP